jgi:hypothetical protein
MRDGSGELGMAASDSGGAAEVLVGGRSTERRTVRLPVPYALVALTAAVLCGVVAGATVFAAEGAEHSESAAVSLTCNGPLSDRRLNVNLSWGAPADSVVLDTGDARKIVLDPALDDPNRITRAVAHQYAADGAYQVSLLARSGLTTAQAECTFNAEGSPTQP